MELKVSSPKPGGLSASDFVSDPEEKEVSDDDDVDRNHKHRRPDTRSQSMERDTYDQVITRPYRKRNKPFANGHSFRDNDSQASTPSKNYNSTPFENFPGKFDKRRPGSASLPRAPFDFNQRMRVNQTFPGDLGPGRERGRDSASWGQRDSRFSSDITSQLGSFPPSMFGGRGMPNVSNSQSASWNAFGLLPGVPNGGLDALHSIGLQGALRPPIHSSLNLGIPLQRCRDFEERGFCLRGDMCPMEHGVNRIVVEDVQSLSQFNLPVSLPSAHLLGKPTGPGPLSSVSASSTTSMNNKGLHSKTSKSSVTDDASLGGADLYDPDQPLWNNNGPETSDAIIGLQSPRNDETDSLSNDDPSDRHQARLGDNADNDFPIRTVGTASGSQSTSVSVWGRIGSSKSRSDVNEKIDPTINYLDNPENENKGSPVNIQNQPRQGKRIISEDAASKPLDPLAKRPYDTMHTVRKPSQKALRTLFVNGIPQKSNRREALVSHFQKFGEILDIYIPSNSERAFVQFSKREEAEAALKAPDAVMGNRFIKLWWANRDSIPEDGPGNGSIVSDSLPSLTAVSVPLYSSVTGISKDNQHSASSKGTTGHVTDASLPSSDNSKPVISNSAKAPPLQKKLELEQLKEELRKKQEMLDQKRYDFRRQLYKLEKQGGPKGEADTELAAKRRKVGLAADVGKVATPSSSSPNTVSAQHDGLLTDKNKSENTVLYHSPKTSPATVLQQSLSLKHQTIRPLATLGTPVPLNRYKLDNRPTGFRILPPLPAGFANVAVMKEHFVPYGDISDVELENLESHDFGSVLDVSKECSARIAFTTRRSAEKAFLNGKCWEGCDLKFVWLTSSNSSNGGEKSPSTTPKGPLSTDVQSADKVACTTSQDASASGDAESEHSERKDGVESEHSERKDGVESEHSERKDGV